MEVTVVNHSAWEQQALDSIEDGLAGSDPQLGSLLATFALLASGEEMPVREKIGVLKRQATRPHRDRSRRRGNVRRDARRLCPRPGLQQTMLLPWFLVTAGMIAMALVLSHNSHNGPCTPSWEGLVCTQQAPAHSPRPTAHQTAVGQG